MRHAFQHLLQTPSVEQAQEAAYGRSRPISPDHRPAGSLGPEETAFIAARDSFYLASVGETGWPYVQHRGGPRGFLRVCDGTRVAFADFSGNRQLLSTGNIAADGRVALFLMDYPARERLKIIGRAHAVTGAGAAEIMGTGGDPGSARVERVFVINVLGFDWNCSQHITPRFTADEVAGATQPLRARIAELEEKLARFENSSVP